jgi:hypothetical protein
MWFVAKAPLPPLVSGDSGEVVTDQKPGDFVRVDNPNILVRMTHDDPRGAIGRCRKRAPTLGGYPVVWTTDWCGDHKLDETKVSG